MLPPGLAGTQFVAVNKAASVLKSQKVKNACTDGQGFLSVTGGPWSSLGGQGQGMTLQLKPEG